MDSALYVFGDRVSLIMRKLNMERRSELDFEIDDEKTGKWAGLVWSIQLDKQRPLLGGA